jgi:hypothetical protein
MNWRAIGLSAAALGLAGLVWISVPNLLDWVGLAAFDPLTRICLVVLILSMVDAALTRFYPH